MPDGPGLVHMTGRIALAYMRARATGSGGDFARTERQRKVVSQLFDKCRSLSLLELVGLKDRMKNKVDQLSGGEQQRVAIAIAMANEPALLLADEPTGAVDTKTADQILDIFRTLNQTLKQTIVVVTHDYRMSEKVDRVVNIRDGKTSSEIIRNISYADELKHLHQHNAEAVRTEWIMLDRVGRLQLPQSYLDDLAIKTPGRIIAERDGERLVLRKE